MAKTYFVLQGQYDQLKVRRLDRYGRLVLDQVINDGKPYWLVTIRGFKEHDRQLLSRALNQGWGNGTRRFVSLESAKAYFDRLAQTPEYGADEKKRQNRVLRARNHARAMIEAGRWDQKI